MKLNFTKSNLTKRKKALALLMSMTIAAGLAGCAPKNANVPINAADAAIVNDVVKLNNDSYYTENKSQPNLSEKEMKTYLPPEDGWTWEKLSQTIYIDGINYELSTGEDILKKYTIVDSTVFDGCTVSTLYNDTGIITVGFDCVGENNIKYDTGINSIGFFKNPKYLNENKNIIQINGVKIGTTLNDLFINMGNPSAINSANDGNLMVCIYDLDLQYKVNFVIIDNQISRISIIFSDDTENKSQSKLSEKEMKTYLPPEDGWTWEKLSQTIYIDGINYESFNKYGDFKGKYLYDEPYTYEDNAAVILSNETAFMAVNFKCGEGNEINDETLIKAIAFYKDEKYPEENKNIIVVNGLKIGATIDELISKMGEPTDAKSDKSENRDIKLYNYISDCGYCISFFINNDYISSVTIIFEE